MTFRQTIRRYVLPCAYFTWVIGLSLWLTNLHAHELLRYGAADRISPTLGHYGVRIAALTMFSLPLIFSFRHSEDWFGPLAMGGGLVTFLAMFREGRAAGYPDLWIWEAETPTFGITVIAFIIYLLVVGVVGRVTKTWKPAPGMVFGALLLPFLYRIQGRVASQDRLAMAGNLDPEEGWLTYIIPAAVLAIVAFRVIRSAGRDESPAPTPEPEEDEPPTETA